MLARSPASAWSFTGNHVVGSVIALAFTPTVRGERPDPARANSPRDLPERCPNQLLWDAVDRSKVPSGKLALHDIIDEGKRLVGFEHPAGFCFQIGDGVPHLVGPVGRGSLPRFTRPKISAPFVVVSGRVVKCVGKPILVL